MVEHGGKNICFSGGADGADTLFGKLAENNNHRVCHYGFAGHRTSCPYHWILTESQLVTADPHILKANKTLKRGSFAGYTPYTKNLLRRNWFQVSNSERVYAVANISKDRRTVGGGTGWAIEMAIQKNIRLIYVFDQPTKKWFQWGVVFGHFGLIAPPPTPHGLYAGIGTSTLTDAGKNAIIKLYQE
jgi:hypothetical protein